jgi:hypothetical protein
MVAYASFYVHIIRSDLYTSVFSLLTVTPARGSLTVTVCCAVVVSDRSSV